MSRQDLFRQLVNKAITQSKETHPDIKDGYSFYNITSGDVERLLWYVLQNYSGIAEDVRLKEMVLACVQKKEARTTIINEFLKGYFADILSDAGFKEKKIKHITEDDTMQMLECILEHYPAVWNNTEFLQGIAMFSRIKPYRPLTERKSS